MITTTDKFMAGAFGTAVGILTNSGAIGFLSIFGALAFLYITKDSNGPDRFA